MRRRSFVRSAIAAVTGVGCSRPGGGANWRFLTTSEAATLDAICARLIPKDGDPGASEARVVQFIDLQLAKTYRKHRRTYREGIAAVNAESRRRFVKEFGGLGGTQADEVLVEIERSSRAFFDLVLTHARQGFYGDPRHGGNYRMASWKMVRLPYPQLRGRQG